MRKKLLSLLLAALMVLGLLPAAAFAAEGDAAPAVQAAEDVAVQADEAEETVAPPTVTAGDTSYDVADTGLTNTRGAVIYKATVPAGTVAVNVDWQFLKDNLNTCDVGPSISCADYGFSKNYSGEAVTVTLSGHDNDEERANSMGTITTEQIAEIKGKADNSMVILSLRWAGWLDGTAPAGGVLCIEIEAASGGDTGDNHVPTLKEDVKSSVRATAYETVPYTVNLSNIFTDEDENDTLTYKVSVNGSSFEAADVNYSYTPATTENSATLIFKANDGKADSADTYTVNLSVQHTPVRLVESGSGEAAAGAYASVSLSSVFKDNASAYTYLDYYVSIDGGDKFFFLNSAKRSAAFKRAFEKTGEHTLVFYAALGPLFSEPYTYTLTVTGDEDVTNYKPYILATAKDEEREEMWTGGGPYYTNWKPDLSKVFGDDLKDPGDNGEYSRLTITLKDDRNHSFRTYYPNTGYATGAGNFNGVGVRTVTFRATDPYGEYVEWVVKVTVKADHRATRKDGALEAYTFKVPFGATLTLKAEDYFQDTDSKDVGTICFSAYQPTYTYTANDPSKDTVMTSVGYSGTENGTESITFTFRTVMPTSWPTINSFSVDTLDGSSSTTTSVEEGDVDVKDVTITQYDSLRVTNGKASAGLISIRMAEDVIAADRESYILSGYSAAITAADAEKMTVGKELGADTDLTKANDYRLANAVSVSQTNTDETCGEYTLTTYYDLMVIGSNARPILAAEKAAVTEKVTQDDAWTIDLNGLFSDADGDPLTYKVSVNGADAAAIEGSTYTYTPADGIHTLVFTANDGRVDSTDTYTVTLLTRRPGAPAWPQVLEFSVDGVKTYGSKQETVPVVRTEIVQYDALVTENSRTYAGEIIIYITDELNYDTRSWYSVEKNTATFKLTNGATTSMLTTSGITMRSSSWTNTSDASITEDGQTYYYYMKMAKTDVPAFEPTIGNGTNTAEAENGVTTFLAGTNASAPTVTVTAPASGWAEGDNTFTVACDKACVVLVKSGETYTKLAAANSGDTHSFTATLAEGDEIIVRLKGDIDGDGSIDSVDYGQAKAAALKKLPLTEIETLCATVTGGTSVDSGDYGLIKAVALNKTTCDW